MGSFTESDFELLEKLGEGGYGLVFKARLVNKEKRSHILGDQHKTNTSDEITVAMKFLQLQDSRGVSQSSLRELQALQRLKHPNIVKYYGAGTTPDGRIFVVIEHCCLSLEKLIRKKTFTTYGPEGKQMLRQVFEAINFLHNNLYIHRDIKTSNILVRLDWSIRLADYGMSRKRMPNMTHQMTSGVGTKNWRAPELIIDKAYPYSFGIDIWSAGMVAYEIFTHSELVDWGLSKLPTGIARRVLGMFVDVESGTPDEDIMKKLSEIVCDQARYYPNKFITKYCSDNDTCPDLSELLVHMLAVNPNRRLISRQIVNHRFFTKAPSIP